MLLSNFEIWEKWAMLLGSFLIAIVVFFKSNTKPHNDWYSDQVDSMWRKIDAGLEVRPSRYLK